MERSVPGGREFDPGTMAPHDEAYCKEHSERSARIVGDWLVAQGAGDELVAQVRALIELHEIGGTPEADLVQAADSLSFLETNAGLVRGWVDQGRCGLDRARQQHKRMLERIQVLAPPSLPARSTGGRSRPRGGTRVSAVEWLAPRSLDEALARKAERGDDATVSRRRTFVGVLVNQGLEPLCLLSLRDVPGLDGTTNTTGRFGWARWYVTARSSCSPLVRAGWPALQEAFALVASLRCAIRRRSAALADADYASDPPAMLRPRDCLAGASWGAPDPGRGADHWVLRDCASPGRADRRREVPGPIAAYRNSALLPRGPASVSAASRGGGGAPAVVGAVADVCSTFPTSARSPAAGPDAELAAEIGRHAERIEPIGDVRVVRLRSV
jgi:hypothetical protein